MSGKRAWKKYMKLIRDFNDPQNTEEYYLNLVKKLHDFDLTLRVWLRDSPREIVNTFNYWATLKLHREIDQMVERLGNMGYGAY